MGQKINQGMELIPISTAQSCRNYWLPLWYVPSVNSFLGLLQAWHVSATDVSLLSLTGLTNLLPDEPTYDKPNS